MDSALDQVSADGHWNLEAPHDECGVFGIWNHSDAAALTALGLHALQHRGQASAGIVSHDAQRFYSHRGLGLVGENFENRAVMDTLKGHRAIGHNRYATTGGVVLRNVQPLYADFAFGGLAVGHNGNLTNATLLRRALVGRGCLFQSTSDSEVFIHLIAMSRFGTVIDRLTDALRQVVGAYSLVALTENALFGARDPLGVRPLILGRVGTDGWVLASETCALEIVDAEFVRDIEPGEIVVITDTGVQSIKPFGVQPSRFCVFEYIYFARPDSVAEGMPVYEARKRIGEVLARESHVAADVVVPVPDSGVPSAMGYAAESGIPFELGIIRNHYVGRTFIEPTDNIRHLGVKLKHSANKVVLAGKRVILVDDSIVRGTTSREIIDMARQAGANSVTFTSAAPPVRYPHVYGINMPSREELVASGRKIPDIATELGADYLIYQEVADMQAAILEGSEIERLEMSCFTGEYVTGTVTPEYLAWVEANQLS